MQSVVHGWKMCRKLSHKVYVPKLVLIELKVISYFTSRLYDCWKEVGLWGFPDNIPYDCP
jgi:hypothetical protein